MLDIENLKNINTQTSVLALANQNYFMLLLMKPSSIMLDNALNLICLLSGESTQVVKERFAGMVIRANSVALDHGIVL